MNLNAVKRAAASVFDAFAVNSLGLFVQRATLFPFMCVVNCHVILEELADSFEAQLHYYSLRFANVTYDDLSAFLKTGECKHAKAGLIFSFDDYSRSPTLRERPRFGKNRIHGMILRLFGVDR